MELEDPDSYDHGKFCIHLISADNREEQAVTG